MPRAEAGLQEDPSARLSRLAEPNPEWRPLLAVLRETLAFEGRAKPPLRLKCAAERARGAPLLHGATLEVEAAWVRERIQRLARAAGVELAEARIAALCDAVMREDPATLEADPAGAILTRFALLPLLAAGAESLPPSATESWGLGYCPVCAAWPLLAELRGLEQARRLRCGRCGSDWRGELLCCGFCGERDHQRLGSLRRDAPAERCAVETCASCAGFLKTVRSLVPLQSAELLLVDLETVEFDLAARERGYTRPLGLGVPLEFRLVMTE